jgi:hypothetical protein
MYPRTARAINAKVAGCTKPWDRAAVPAKKPAAQRRTESPKVRYLRAELALYRRAARASGMDFSAFVREALREKVERMRSDGAAV